MEKDKRDFYNWIMVLILNIGVITGSIFLFLNSHSDFFIVVPIATLFATVLPILLSKSNLKFKKILVLGIFLLLFLLIPIYIMWLGHNCVDWDCLEFSVQSFFSKILSFIFIVYYIIGTYSKEISPRLLLVLSIAVPFLIPLFLFMFFSIYRLVLPIVPIF